MDLNVGDNINDLEFRVSEIISRTSALRELTYSYKDLWEGLQFNETIFLEYLNSSLEINLKNLNQGVLCYLLVETRSKLDSDISILRSYLSDCPIDEKNSIELLIHALDFTQESLEFELEAAWYDTWMSEDEVKTKTQKLFELDAKVFWEHVSNNPKFLSETYAYLQYLFSEFWSDLETEHRDVILNALDAIGNQLIDLSWEESIWSTIPDFVPEQESEDFKKLKDIIISRADYMKIFDAFFEVSGVTQRSKITDHGTFFDGDEYYWVPESSSYDTKSLGEILKLWPHEAWHYINLKVTNDRGDIKRLWDMGKEEWWAILTEKLVSWVSFDSMSSITFSAPSVVIARLLPWDQYMKFQDAYGDLLVLSKIHSSKRDVMKEFLRKKRGFSKKNPWWSNKDASYSLGLFSVLDYIKTGEWDFKNLFWGKISMQDVQSWEFTPKDFWNKYIVHIIFSELIFFYLRNKNQDFNHCEWLHWAFVKYFKEKYKYFSEDFDLFNEAEKFCMKNKRKVVEVLRIVKRSQENSMKKE